MDYILLDTSGSDDKKQPIFTHMYEKDLLHVMSFLQRSEIVNFFKAVHLDQNKECVYLKRLKVNNFRKVRKLFIECSLERDILKKLISKNSKLAIKYSSPKSWNFISALRAEVQNYSRIEEKNCGMFWFILGFLSMNLFIMLGCLSYQIRSTDSDNSYALLLTQYSGLGAISSIFLIFYPVYKIMGNSIDAKDNLNNILFEFSNFKRSMLMKVNHFENDSGCSEDEKSAVVSHNRRII